MVIPISLYSSISLWSFLQYPQSTSVKTTTEYSSFLDLNEINSLDCKFDKNFRSSFEMSKSVILEIESMFIL